MTPDEITALFAVHSRAFNLRDMATLVVAYADNCVLESSMAGTVIGRVGIENVYRQFFLAFPDVKFEPQGLLVAGDQVVRTGLFSGTDTGGFLGQAPTGKSFRVFIVLLFTLEGGQIVFERRVYDVNGLLLQLATDLGPGTETSQRYRAAFESATQEHELKIAAEIQRALLPERQYMGAGFEIAAASVPCRAIGGDFFDYFELPNSAFGFALGDVSGKGPPAALLAAELQGVLAAHSYTGGTPADTVTRVNQVLVRRPVESRFATLLYGVLSSGGLLTYCNAGHNPPLLVSRRGMRRLETGGLILGAFKEATFEEEIVQLDCGDVLVVFSDGVTDALSTDGADFGEERLQSCVQTNRELPPTALLECVFDSVREFSVSAVQNDDLTVLVLRYAGN